MNDILYSEGELNEMYNKMIEVEYDNKYKHLLEIYNRREYER